MQAQLAAPPSLPRRPTERQHGHTATACRCSLLYSGRFFGGLTPDWIYDHLQHLIVPTNASVYVVADTQNWCHAPPKARELLEGRTRRGFLAASAIFEAEVRAAFHQWHDVHAQLLPDDHEQNTRACPNAFGKLERWRELGPECNIWPNLARSVFSEQRTASQPGARTHQQDTVREPTYWQLF